MTRRTIFLVAALLLAGLLSAACGSDGAPDEAPAFETADTSAVRAEGLDSVTMVVPDMVCALCARSIESHLTRAGVAGVRVDLDAKRVHARFDPVRLSPDSIRSLVTGLGYSVTAMEEP